MLFIIGLITTLAALGFSKANRQKQLDSAARVVKSAISNARDYALFGQEVEGKYPCGFGVVLNKDSGESSGIKTVYVQNADRIEVMETDNTCDDKVKGSSVKLAVMDGQEEQEWADSVLLTGIKNISGGAESCSIILFSAPRSGSYYCSCDACPPTGDTNCACSVFSDDSGELNEKYFQTEFEIVEGILSDTLSQKIYASGNTEEVQ